MTTLKEALTPEKARTLLDYNPATGLLTWRVDRGRSIKAKTEAGTTISRGNRQYIAIKVEGRIYAAHRLAFLTMTGAWPKNHVDHIDQNGTNNAWGNLRDIPPKLNQRNRRVPKNNKSGVTGVYSLKGKWVAKISAHGRVISLGSFESFNAAAQARKLAEITHGYTPSTAAAQGA